MNRRSLVATIILAAAAVWAGNDTGVRVNGLVLGPTTSAKGTSPWSYSNRTLKLTGEGSDYETWCYAGNAAVYAHWTSNGKSASVRVAAPLSVAACEEDEPAPAPFQFAGTLADGSACVVLLEPAADGTCRVVVVTAAESVCHTASVVDFTEDDLVISTDEDTIVVMGIERMRY